MSEQFKNYATQVDISSCAREPIHISCAIQPHGFLLSFSKDKILRRISQNILDKFAVPAGDVVGHDINQAPLALKKVLEECLCIDVEGSLGFIQIDDLKMLARPLRANEEHVIELEPFLFDPGTRAYEIFSKSIKELAKLSDVEAVCDFLSTSIRQMLSYDRVMIYRFDHELNGKVISEAKNEALIPFLGLNYPASDIPPQAHALYKKNLSRLIVDVDYVPSTIVSVGDSEPLDLTLSNLRSVSPIHLQYLRNMGVRATLTLSIMVRGELWGLLACHQTREAKYISPALRTKAEALTSIAALLINTIESGIQSKVEAQQSSTVAKVVFLLEAGESVGTAISAFQAELRALTDSSGLAGIFSNKVLSWGELPPEKFILDLADWLKDRIGSEHYFCTDSLPAIWDDAIQHKGVSCGILAIRLPQMSGCLDSNSLLIWFRPEVLSTISWGGNPNKAVELDELNSRISPRHSFEEWKQHVRLKSQRWTDQNLSAAINLGNKLVDFSINSREKLNLLADLRNAEKLSTLGSAITEVTHDLRSPLSQIRSAIDILRDEIQMSEEQKEIFDLIPQSLELAHNYMDDILSFSKHVKLKKIGCDLKIFLEDTCSNLRIIAEEKEVELTLSTPMGVLIEIDAIRLGRAIINLANNAIDALCQNSIASPLVTIIASKDDAILEIQISDNGPGIPSEIQDRLFTPFATFGKLSGTGLGLTIAKKMVEAHGGTITFNSASSGTTFLIKIPSNR